VQRAAAARFYVAGEGLIWLWPDFIDQIRHAARLFSIAWPLAAGGLLTVPSLITVDISRLGHERSLCQ
jgi:hypothetical protein